MSFFFPDIHEKIDFSRGYEFLEQELRQIALPSETGKKVIDKLAKVFLFNGEEKWLLIHIEIQGYAEEAFPERMYIYNYRIFDKKRKDVLSLALLTDNDPSFRSDEYRRSLWGVEVIFRYRIVKVIDWIMKVPEGLDTKIFNEIKAVKEASRMPYITTAERIGMQQCMQKGMKQSIATIIETKFGKAGYYLNKRAKKINNVETLRQLMKKLLTDVPSLTEAEKIFGEIELQCQEAKS